MRQPSQRGQLFGPCPGPARWHVSFLIPCQDGRGLLHVPNLCKMSAQRVEVFIHVSLFPFVQLRLSGPATVCVLMVGGVIASQTTDRIALLQAVLYARACDCQGGGETWSVYG